MNGKEALITDPAWMEPMLPEESNRKLEDVAFDLTSKASSLAGQVNPVVAMAIGGLVRSMNCYYSNLIEGHDTHPRDIDRALHRDFSTQPKKRALQLEAVAHIEVQRAIDEGKDDPAEPLTTEYVLWLHRKFCNRLPDEMLWVEDPHSGRKVHVRPGELRNDELEVGRHLPPAAASLPSFLGRFEQAYKPRNLSKIRQIVRRGAAPGRAKNFRAQLNKPPGRS